MSVIIFIIVLGVLIFVHELGHFLVAKKSGIRVDEFAIGFPPKLFSFERGGTKYALNLIPFGGYVKIYGENAEDNSVDPNAKDSFVNKSPWIQAGVLVAGVAFNIIFAFILFWITLMSGSPTVVTPENQNDVRDVKVAVISVSPNSPAEQNGLKAGDTILEVSNGQSNFSNEAVSVENVQETIKTAEENVDLKVMRGNQELTFSIKPQEKLVGENQGIGIGLEKIGIHSLPIHRAFIQAFTMTGNALTLVTVGLYGFIAQAVTGQASLDQVAGPVGIVGIVGEAASFGLVYLLGFTALISLNLAVLNVLPFPALDGGRLVMVAIEGITRKKLNPKIVGWVNAGGFILLVTLMIVITINDIVKLF